MNAFYLQAAPPIPLTNSQPLLPRVTERSWQPLPLHSKEYRRHEQERLASIVDKLLPGYWEKRKEDAQLAARFLCADEVLDRTQSELNKLEQQRAPHEQCIRDKLR